MKKTVTLTLSLCLLLLCFGGLSAQHIGTPSVVQKKAVVKEAIEKTCGKAPMVSRVVRNTIPSNVFRGETSQAISSLGETFALNHFTLIDPVATTPYGTYGTEFLNSAEFFGGMFYYSSYLGSFGTIDPLTGVINTISTGNPYGSIAYNPTDDQLYGLSLGPNPVLYLVDQGSGVATGLITSPSDHYIFGMTITNDGRILLIDGEVNGISEMDPETGTLTTLWTAGFTVNYGQDMACDRETNTPYWAAYNADASTASLFAIDVNNATGTYLGDFSEQAACFSIQTEPNLALAVSPTNLVLTPDPNQGLTAVLAWNNPTTTLAGDPLTNIQKMVVKRNGEIVQEFLNPTVGAAMTYTDNVPISAYYTYSVYAVTSEGDGVPAIASATVGTLCTIKVYGHDAYGDGWTGNFIGFQDPFGNQFGFFTVYGNETSYEYSLPKGSIIQCVWYPGGYSNEVDSICIMNDDSTVIYSSSTPPADGIFYTFSNKCSEIVPNPPSDFVAAGIPNQDLSVLLSWTNPATDINGQPLTDLSKIVILRDNVVIEEIENPTIGETMNFIDNVPETGAYSYMIYAVNETGTSDPVSTIITVGDLCLITIDMYDGYGDGWGTAMITILQGDEIIGTATLGSGSFASVVFPTPMGATDFQWTQGVWDDEISFTIKDAFDVPIYQCDNAYGIPNGQIFFSFDNNCAMYDTIEVSGVITKVSDNSPIEGASVIFDGLLGDTLITDAQGYYVGEFYQGYVYDIIVKADGYNTITDEDFIVPLNPITKNYAMTAPSISVNPTDVTITATYQQFGSASVTVTNNGNGPLTYYVTPEYEERTAVEGISYEEFLQSAGNLPHNDAPKTFAAAPSSTSAYVYNPLPTRYENSNALICFTEQLNRFTLNNPAVATPFGTASEMISSAEYIDGVYYYSTAINGIFGTIDHETGACSWISYGNNYGAIAYNPVDQQLYGISLSSPAILFSVDRETGASTPLLALQTGFILSFTIDNDGRFFVINASFGGICEVDPTTGEFINMWSSGFSVNYGQDISCDRTQNQIYWSAYNADADAAQLYHVNTQTGDMTLMGTFQDQASGFAIDGSVGWLQSDPLTKVIQAGSSQTVTLTADGGFNVPGTYHAVAHFNSKNPNAGTVDVNVTLVIEDPDCETPTNVEATGNSDAAEIVVQWDGASDDISYNIFANGIQVMTGVTETTATLTNITFETEYCIQIQAVCAAGIGVLSEEACVTVPAPQICPVPTNLVALSNNLNAINLTWSAPATRDEVILFDDFEDVETEGIPEGWLVLDNDGDGVTWYGLNGIGTIFGHSGMGLVTSASYQTVPLTPDNFLITPMFEGANVVNYWVGAQDADYSYEHYAVCASSTGTNASDFTILFEETMVGKGTQPTGERGTKGQGTWYERTIDLPEGTKYLAFRHFDCTDAFRLNVDDVAIKNVIPEVLVYNVYRDGSLLIANVEGEAYSDTEIQNNVEYCYTVTHVCSFGESDPSNEDCESLIVGINENENDYQIFPNPANTKVTIKGENIENIVVYNVLGQVINNIQVAGNTSIDINTAAYEAGVYMLRIVAHDGSMTTQRVVITH
ncbi:MAG: choice-of-anchor J domain-containing protein [Bacteroidales bacterium]|nr:choice-of-anchor J domain-containing protein [Bacteroidales bacterium]